MEQELCRAFALATHDAEVRVAVLAGAGKTLSAGCDFSYIRENLEDPSFAWDGA